MAYNEAAGPISKIRTDDVFRRVEVGVRRETDDGCIFLDDQNEMFHRLNYSGAITLDCCDGTRTVLDIAGVLQRIYGLDHAPIEDVRLCAAELLNKNLVVRGSLFNRWYLILRNTLLGWLRYERIN